MMLSVVLAICGLLLIYIEFFLPGGVMGIFGAMLLIASVINFSYQDVGPIFLFLYIFVLAFLLFFCIKYALKKVKKSGSMFLNSDQEGYYASGYKKDLIGKEGVASSDLKPSGYILIEDNYYQAVSKTGYIEKGAAIKVIGGRGSNLICKNVK